MFNDPNLMAKGQSLQDLIAAMDEDQSKRIPGVTIIIAGSGDNGQSEPDSDDQSSQGAPPQPPALGGDMGGGMNGGAPDEDTSGMDPFEALIAKKKKEQMGVR